MAGTNRRGESAGSRSLFEEQIAELVGQLEQGASRLAAPPSAPGSVMTRREGVEPSSQSQLGRAVVPSSARLPAHGGRITTRSGALVSRGLQSRLGPELFSGSPREESMGRAMRKGTTKVWDTDWVTLFGASGATVVRLSAPQDEYLDAGAYSSLTLRISMPGVTNIGLAIEHSGTIDGEYHNVFATEEKLSGTTTATVVLSSEGGDRVFSRYLRWTLDLNSGAAVPQWRACFRIEGYV